jgi:4-amino-4-deoxy-L-arabinose transferase-like glycosyltransferase
MGSFDFISRLKKIPTHVWILIFLMSLGLLLRSYNLHDWLHFGKDQSRDAFITQAVARGENSWPLLGATMGNTPFAIGPMYYYFQIISAKIFGQDPAVLAYPDILFSVLSIPLLFLFLKKYFNKNISLGLTGLYSISYFSIEYARFAWNTNPIPFFVLLFMLSIYEFLIAKSATKWAWIVGVGVAVGVGVQLHAILMILLPVMTLLVSIFIMIKNPKAWKKVLAVFLLAIFLNAPQIFSEIQSNFANTKIFLASSFDKSSPDEGEFARDLNLNLACHAQANMHILSSMGDKYDCNFMSILSHGKKKIGYASSVLLVVLSIVFSIFAYGLLVFKIKTDGAVNKRYFLGLVLLFALLFFPLLMPAIDGASHRYFICVIFVPFVLLGLLLEFALSFKQQIFKISAILMLALLFGANLLSVSAEASQLSDLKRGNSGFAVLGQVEQMRNYMIQKADGKKQVYLFGGSNYLPFYALAMQYVFAKTDVAIIRGNDKADLADFPIFYVWRNSEGKAPQMLDGRKVLEFKDFGQIGIYKLQGN